MFDCLACGREVDNTRPRFFVCPGMIMVPNEYYLCDDHKDRTYTFEDIYNKDATRKKVIGHGRKRE